MLFIKAIKSYSIHPKLIITVDFLSQYLNICLIQKLVQIWKTSNYT
jgi:hypothetical protein